MFIQTAVKELIRQCFVQFRCQLIEEKLSDQEAIFIDVVQRLKQMRINLRLSGEKKSIEKYHHSQLIERSNQLSL